MFTAMKSFIGEQIGQISEAGLYKGERVITSPQGMHISSPKPNTNSVSDCIKPQYRV